MFTEIAPGIFSVESRFVDGKNGIIFGSRAALAVDGSNYSDEGQAMADFIRKRGCQPNRLALTHGHGDHILGAAPLAGGEIFAHALTPGVIRKQIPQFAEKWEVSVEEARNQVIKPTVIFRDELWIELGNKRVWMFPTPGHSVDGVSIYIEADKVLFAGDSVVTGIVAAIGDGNSEVLEASLRKLMGVDSETLVPGHGEVLYGADRVQDWLNWQAEYLSRVRQTVKDVLAQGQDAETAIDAVDFETFIGSRLPADRNSMPWRHRMTVAKIAEEESAKLHACDSQELGAEAATAKVSSVKR